jgi:hypothetical protein
MPLQGADRAIITEMRDICAGFSTVGSYHAVVKTLKTSLEEISMPSSHDRLPRSDEKARKLVENDVAPCLLKIMRR